MANNNTVSIFKEKIEYYRVHPDKRGEIIDRIKQTEGGADHKRLDLSAGYSEDEPEDILANVTLVPITSMEEFSDRAVILSAYKSILGRNADAEGLNHYLKLIDEGTISRHDLINIFKDSPEAKIRRVEIIGQKVVNYTELMEYNDSNFVIHAYAQLLDRIPSKRSIKELSQKLAEGIISKEQIIENIRSSEEYSLRPKYITNTDYLYMSELVTGSTTECIERMYRQVLGREADADGLRSQTENLLRGLFTREQLVLILRNTPEGQEKGMEIRGIPDKVALPGRFDATFRTNSNKRSNAERDHDAVTAGAIWQRLDDIQRKNYEDINNLKGDMHQVLLSVGSMIPANSTDKRGDMEDNLISGIKAVRTVAEVRNDELKQEVTELREILSKYEERIRLLESKITEGLNN